MKLIEEMESYLPIPVYPSRELCHFFQKQGKDITPETELKITQVFDSGNIGGIVCKVLEEEMVYMVSLTHLRVKPDHPLSEKIRAYQKQRIKRIMRSGRYEQL